MSHDHHLLRLRKPAGCLNDLTPDHVVHLDWYEEAREILRSTFTGIRWNETSSDLRRYAAEAGAGRL